jgi:hypothetical protein
MAKTVVFESKFTELVLVRQCRAQIPIPDGTGWQTTRRTLEYKFRPENSQRGLDRRGDLDRADPAEHGWVGVLRVKEGQDVLSTDSESWLKPGEDVGVERDAVAALMAHRGFGTRFWVAGHEPGTVYPRPQDLRKDIRRWTVKLDEESLEAALREEQATHQRQDLVTELSDALALVREERATLAASQPSPEAEQEQEPEPEPAPKAKAKPKAGAAA